MRFIWDFVVGMIGGFFGAFVYRIVARRLFR